MCTCAWSEPDAVIGKPRSQSTPTTPPWREGREVAEQAAPAAQVRFDALEGLTQPNVRINVPGLARPVGKPADECRTDSG